MEVEDGSFVKGWEDAIVGIWRVSPPEGNASIQGAGSDVLAGRVKPAAEDAGLRFKFSTK